jgi:uncharacterized membrane protein
MARKPASQTIANKPVASMEGERIGLERLIFFSDAVFAIALTLLALEIRLPEGTSSFSNDELYGRLISIWPQYLAYVLSFLTVGVFWRAHHRRFQMIIRYDQRLIWLNMLLLMLIAFIPFPTSVISESGNRTATIFYALTLAGTGLISLAIWLYASVHDRLITPGLSKKERRQKIISSLVMPGVFLLSIGIAFIDADLAKYSWILILPGQMFIH